MVSSLNQFQRGLSSRKYSRQPGNGASNTMETQSAPFNKARFGLSTRTMSGTAIVTMRPGTRLM